MVAERAGSSPQDAEAQKFHLLRRKNALFQANKQSLVLKSPEQLLKMVQVLLV